MECPDNAIKNWVDFQWEHEMQIIPALLIRITS